MKRIKFAPVAVFAYRRAEILDKVLDALEACKEFDATDVYVFCDGAKNDTAKADVAKVRARVRERARARSNFTVVESTANMGLSASIISGVTRLCNEYGRAIVIEDDLIVSPALLTWFNAALERFAEDEQVMQVSGHMFGRIPNLEVGFFLPLTTSWGWAIWKRAWSQFDPAATGWEALAKDAELRRKFDFDGAYPYSQMLERQMVGKVDSWAIRWYWRVFNTNGIVLFPPASLVNNEGQDAAGTHVSFLGRIRALFRPPSPPLPTEAPPLPVSVKVDARILMLAKHAISNQ